MKQTDGFTPLQAVLILFSIAVPSSMAAMIGPALPDLASDLRISPGEVNWIVSSYMAGFVLGQLIYGPIGGGIGQRSSMRTGFVLAVLGSLGVVYGAYTQDNTVIVVFRFLSGLGAAAGLVCAIILIKEHNPPTKAKTLLSYAVLAFVLSIYACVFIIGFIVSFFGWKASTLVMLGYCAAVVGVTFFMPSSWDRLGTGANGIRAMLGATASGYADALKNRTLLSYSFILSISTVISYTFTASAPLISDDLLGLTPSGFGTWTLLNAIGTLLGAFISSRMVQSLNERTIVATGLAVILCATAALLLMYFVQSESALWFFSMTCLLFLGQGLIFPSCAHLATSNVSDPAMGTGAMSFLNMFLGLMAVFVSGAMASLGVFFIFIACLAFFSTACLVVFGLGARKNSVTLGVTK